jgi:hypothetical protein
MLKSLLLSATFVGASVIGAAAQNSTPSGGNSFPSPATHCKDKATGQVRTKKAAEDGSRTRMSGQEDTRGLEPDRITLKRILHWRGSWHILVA